MHRSVDRTEIQILNAAGLDDPPRRRQDWESIGDTTGGGRRPTRSTGFAETIESQRGRTMPLPGTARACTSHLVPGIPPSAALSPSPDHWIQKRRSDQREQFSLQDIATGKSTVGMLQNLRYRKLT